MKNPMFAAVVSGLLIGILIYIPIQALSSPGQTYQYGSPAYSPSYNPYGYPGINTYTNPYASPYMNPYINPYVNPYHYSYPNIYRPYNLAPGVSTVYPNFGIPQALGGGYFNITTGNTALRVWQAPSGYYYPWCSIPSWQYAAPIIYVMPGSTTPTAAQPPISTIFSDLNKFLEESSKTNKITQPDYNHLKLRAGDLQSKERMLRTGSGGTLTTEQEMDLRKDIDQLNQEVAQRVRQ